MNTIGQPGYIDQIKWLMWGVYRLIDQLAPVSGIELSKRAHLALTGITTKIVCKLLEVNLVNEVKYQDLSNCDHAAIDLALTLEGSLALSFCPYQP